MFCQLQTSLLLISVVFSSRSEAVSPNAEGEQQLSCPTFWTLWKNNCYRYFGAEVSWYDALHICRTFSTEENLRGFADLVSIHSEEEHDFVYHYWKSLREADARANKPGLWIGLNDIDQHGVFVWSDHSIVDYMNFDNGQADREDQQLYFIWDWEDEYWQPHGKWHDVGDGPSWYFKFMCKMAARPSAEL